MTNQLLAEVREPSKDRSIPAEDISPQRRRQMVEIYEACRKLTVKA